MIKKFENFVNESLNERKRDDVSPTNILKRVVRVQFYNYLSNSTLEKYKDNKFNRHALKYYLKEICHLDENNYETLIYRLGSTRSPYTLGEFKKILKILFNVFGRKRSDYVCSILKVLFEPITDDFERDYEDKLDALRGQKIVKDKNIPIVIGINGKILTGEVYYNEFLDIYTETEDEMRGAIDKFISSSFYKTIEMLDDDNIDDFSQVKKYSRVNLSE